MYYIYQILGNFGYKSVNFAVRTMDDTKLNRILLHKNEKQNLASIHIFKCLNIKEKKLIFLVPASLYSPSTNIREKLIPWGLNEEEYEIIKMPANGAYDTGIFDYTPDEVLFFLYIDMISRLKIGDTVFMDINAGLNEYVDSLNDAISYAYVTLGLLNLGTDENHHDLEVYKIISEPVMRTNVRDIYSVYIQKVSKKIFFSLPSREYLKPGSTLDASPDTKKEFTSKFSLKNYYRTIIDNSIIIFNSIKMNTLSVLVTDENLVSIEMKNKILECLKEIITIYYETFFKDISSGNRQSKIQNVGKIISFIMSLNMYLGFINLLEKRVHGVRNSEDNSIINLDKLENFAREIYENDKINMRLNLQFLQRDIHEFKNYTEKIEKERKTSNDKKIEGNAKRNFFAHSGIDYNTVNRLSKNEVKFVGELEERKKWLLSADK